jgi:hypothetical protein
MHTYCAEVENIFSEHLAVQKCTRLPRDRGQMLSVGHGMYLV